MFKGQLTFINFIFSLQKSDMNLFNCNICQHVITYDYYSGELQKDLLIHYPLLSSAETLCKQFGPRSGPTEGSGLIWVQIVWHFYVFCFDFLKTIILKTKSADDKNHETFSRMQRVTVKPV